MTKMAHITTDKRKGFDQGKQPIPRYAVLLNQDIPPSNIQCTETFHTYTKEKGGSSPP